MTKRIVAFFLNNWLTILLAIVPPIAMYQYLERDVWQLDVVLRNNTPVVQIAEKYAHDISVYYQSNQIACLNVLEIEVRNSGNKPIEAEQFKEALRLTFAGAIVPSAVIINKSPDSLTPIFSASNANQLVSSPLLLNKGDRFAFLAYVVNCTNLLDPVALSARISAVRDPRFLNQTEQPNKRRSGSELLPLLATLIAAIVSTIAVVLLTRRVREVSIDFSPGGAPVISFHIGDVKAAVQRLAADLKIDQHDAKSSLLLLRITIEDQLRELARRSSLPDSIALKSPAQISRELVRLGVLPVDVDAGITGVLRVMNRELHAAETYLIEAEWKRLQQLSLQIIATLAERNAKMTNVST